MNSMRPAIPIRSAREREREKRENGQQENKSKREWVNGKGFGFW